MTRMLQTLLVLLAMLSSYALVGAQDLDDPYAGVPQSRTADGAFVLGDPDTAIKLIEFSDFSLHELSELQAGNQRIHFQIRADREGAV